MYNDYGNARIYNTHIIDSKIDSGEIERANIKDSCIYSSTIFINDNNNLNIDGDLSCILVKLNDKIENLQKQNEFLLKLLVNKSVLNNENEVLELIESHKIIDKLSGV